MLLKFLFTKQVVNFMLYIGSGFKLISTSKYYCSSSELNCTDFPQNK